MFCEVVLEVFHPDHDRRLIDMPAVDPTASVGGDVVPEDEVDPVIEVVVEGVGDGVAGSLDLVDPRRGVVELQRPAGPAPSPLGEVEVERVASRRDDSVRPCDRRDPFEVGHGGVFRIEVGSLQPHRRDEVHCAVRSFTRTEQRCTSRARGGGHDRREVREPDGHVQPAGVMVGVTRDDYPGPRRPMHDHSCRWVRVDDAGVGHTRERAVDDRPRAHASGVRTRPRIAARLDG